MIVLYKIASNFWINNKLFKRRVLSLLSIDIGIAYYTGSQNFKINSSSNLSSWPDPNSKTRKRKYFPHQFHGVFLFVFRQSERLVMVFKMGAVPEMVHTLTLDVSPAVLIPFYDEDSGTLFLSSKVRNSQLYQKYSEACQWCHRYYVKIWHFCQITLEKVHKTYLIS